MDENGVKTLKHAHFVGKGKSLDRLDSRWFSDEGSEIWCLNQSADLIRGLFPERRVVCCQNDDWINYAPPSDVEWRCRHRVPVGDHPSVIRYVPETLTGFWAAPTCLCALEMMRREGIGEITMVGFDSHFDGSRSYADCLGVKSDGKAKFHFYDTMMRRWSRKTGVVLKWMDAEGAVHEDDFRFRRCILGVAMGERYARQTDRMIDSFLQYNPTWDAERFYDGRIAEVIPRNCRSWSAFNKCEIGRWVAMQKLLDEKYDTVLYCDGDIRWYGEYEEHDAELVLTPHTVTRHGSCNDRHWIMQDGRANIGIIETNRGVDHDMLFDFIINETLHSPRKFMHGSTLWLQNLVSSCSDVGFDVLWNLDPGMNVAYWNLREKDRSVFLDEDGRYMVKTDSEAVVPLRSFHFSSKSIERLDGYGEAVRRLKTDYLGKTRK